MALLATTVSNPEPSTPAMIIFSQLGERGHYTLQHVAYRPDTSARLIVSLRNLSTYRKKRDFEKTAEPSGDTPVVPSKQRRFVIQAHDATRLHYDLRLEVHGVLKSWAVTRGPPLRPHAQRPAGEVGDHPLV